MLSLNILFSLFSFRLNSSILCVARDCCNAIEVSSISSSRMRARAKGRARRDLGSNFEDIALRELQNLMSGNYSKQNQPILLIITSSYCLIYCSVSFVSSVPFFRARITQKRKKGEKRRIFPAVVCFVFATTASESVLKRTFKAEWCGGGAGTRGMLEMKVMPIARHGWCRINSFVVLNSKTAKQISLSSNANL